MTDILYRNITIDEAAIVDFCRQWEIVELALFGSVLRDDFSSNSDVDVLFKKRDNMRHTLDELISMKAELETVFGRNVDIVPKKVIEADPNYLRRQAILNVAEVIYAE